MAHTNGQDSPDSNLTAEDIIAEVDIGGRRPTGFSAKLLIVVPLLWSLFQLWYASPLPFMASAALRDISPVLSQLMVINDNEARDYYNSITRLIG